MMTKEFTVSQITEYIADVLKRDYVLSSVCILGEVSNCRESSGHIFFTLKDENCQLPAVMFASAKASGLHCAIKDGIKIKASGYIGVYPQSGRYQLYCTKIEADGIGSLYEQFEALKKKLSAEGLFENSHKKEIPKYVNKLGVITAVNGAAVRDIINVAKRRFPYIKIIVYPATVQGSNAPQTLIRGLKKMEEVKPDCIIIGRGGGSLEDLNCFNDEALARAVYDCPIPVISAVGHEIDFTIIDFVADKRAATPSVAAELAVFDYNAYQSTLVDYHSNLLGTMMNKLDGTKKQLKNYELAVKNYSPKRRIDNYKLQSIHCSERLNQLITGKIDTAKNNLRADSADLKNIFIKRLTESRHRLELQKTKLNGLAPTNKLEMGYSYITDKDGHNISSINSVEKGKEISITVKDGVFDATVK